MDDDSYRRMRLGLVIVASIVLALLAWFWAVTHLPFPPPSLMEPPRPPPGGIPGDIELYYILNAVFSTLNATLLVILLALYAEIYIKRKVEFTLWLIIFCSVLLLYAFTSNPIIQWAFGFRPFGLGPFAVLPDVFTFVALVILFYLTMKY
jgi:hypothetical protein